MVVAAVLANNYVIWWVAQLVAIAILVALFLRWRPGFLGGRTIGETLGASLDARNQQIEEQLAAAERSRQEAARLQEQTKLDIEHARAEAEQIESGASQTSAAILEEMRQRAHEEAERVVAQAHTQIEQERQQAIQALQRRAADIVIDAAGQVVARNLDAAGDREIIVRSLDRMGDGR